MCVANLGQRIKIFLKKLKKAKKQEAIKQRMREMNRKHGSYQSNYINNHAKRNWSTCIN